MNLPIVPGSNGGLSAAALSPPPGWCAKTGCEETWADRAGLQGEFAWALGQLMGQLAAPPQAQALVQAPASPRGTTPEAESLTRATQQTQLREQSWPLPPPAPRGAPAWQLSLPAQPGVAGGAWTVTAAPGVREGWALQVSSPPAVAPALAAQAPQLTARLQTQGVTLESLAFEGRHDDAAVAPTWRQRRNRS